MLGGWIGLWVACAAGDKGPAGGDSGDSPRDTEVGWPEDSDSGPGGDSGGDSGDDTAPVDADGDGYSADVDCDDADSAVHPTAEELFNGADDDCDGRVDAVGTWAGTASLSAQATYEGTRYSFSLGCPVVLERELLDADFEVLCTTDPGDAWAQLLLGATVSFTPRDTYLWDLERWEGDVEVRSSNGWDSQGSGEVSWSSVDRAVLELDLTVTFLTIRGSATLRPAG